MEQNSVRTLYRRYEWVAERLQREAYRLQMKNRTTPLRRFIPCDKALVFTRAMGDRDGVPSSVVIADAAVTICPCHQGAGEKELWALFDAATKEIPQEGGEE